MPSILEKVTIKKVIGPTPAGAAILIGNDAKTFVVFIGFHEAQALLRELKREPAPRPLTHDLIQSIFLGFDLAIKQVVISSIIDNAFCATLILEQKSGDGNEQKQGQRNEVRIDARPSDCFVLALKSACEIYVTREVLEQVQDFSQMSKDENPWLGQENLMMEETPGERKEPFLEEEDTEEEDDDDDGEPEKF